MGRENGRSPQGAESFRVQQPPIILGEPPHSCFDELTPDAIAAETRRLFDIKRTDELVLGLRPDVLAAVASMVAHKGMSFQDVAAAIQGEQLHLSGTVKKWPVTFSGRIVVANGEHGLQIIAGSLGPLTRMIGDINSMITKPMSESLGRGYAVDRIRIETPGKTPGITEPILTARVTRGQLLRRAA